jgi:hypothetical protein
MLAQIPLDSDLAETLEELARQQGLSLEQIADKVVRQYVPRLAARKSGSKPSIIGPCMPASSPVTWMSTSPFTTGNWSIMTAMPRP